MVRTVLISFSDKRIINELHRIGIAAVPVKRNVLLDRAVSTHADCAALRIGSVIFSEKGNYERILGSTGDKEKIICLEEEIFSPYPNDVKLNAKVFGRKILCNENFLSAQVKEFAVKQGYEFTHCNQGYAACSTVKINDNAAITDDESVYKALNSENIDCLLVNKGSVRLEGYDYGFIGGSCAMISENRLAFFGNIRTHSDSKKIIGFLNSHMTEYINLTDDVLTDIGGMTVIE